MASSRDTRKEEIDNYIDQNLKKVFADLEQDQMPDQIVDLLNVLRAQDAELNSKADGSDSSSSRADSRLFWSSSSIAAASIET